MSDPHPGDDSAAVDPGDPDLVVVGRVGRPQGVRGEVTVEVRTDDPEQRFAVGSVLRTEPAERGPLMVERARDHSGRLVVAFEGVPDRSAAEALRDTLLLVDIRSLPALDDPDEFHDWQLRGLSAVLSDGSVVGVVTDVLHLPHGDVLVLSREGDRAEALVPFVRAIVPEVDLAAGRLVLDPPPGLLEEDALEEDGNAAIPAAIPAAVDAPLDAGSVDRPEAGGREGR